MKLGQKFNNPHRLRTLCWSCSIFALAALPLNIYGLGFRVPNLDAEATGRGNAFVATAHNPAALYYNPAGITQLEGHNIQFGAHLISVNSEYTSPTGVEAKSEFEIIPVPQFYYTYTPKESPLSFGLGAYAPFGLCLEWEEANPFRSKAVEGRLTYMTLNPVVAWQAHRTFSVAIGPTINYSQVLIRQGIGLVPGDEFKFRGEDFDFGFSAGLLWQPHQKWSFGASYRSATTIDYDGGAHVKGVPLPVTSADTTASADYPQVVTAGISFRPTPKWNIEVDVDWTDWDVLNTITFEGTRNIFGADVQFPLNWKSSWLYEFGVSRYFENGYFVSGGYFFSQNSTSERDFNPIVPDTDLHVGSLGFGHKGDHWRWALSGQIITGAARSIGDGANPLVQGDYQWFNQAVNFSVGYHF